MAIVEKIIVFSAAAIFIAYGAGSEYNYIRGDPLGPERWPELFSQCGGEANSPIDLSFRDADYGATEKFEFIGWNRPKTYEVENEGATVKFTLNEEGTVQVRGGGLGSTYDLVQFHLHWGSASNRVGSEHTINGKSFPMELHLVHKRSDFDSISDALSSGEPDALAVLGVFFKLNRRFGFRIRRVIRGAKAANSQSIDRFRLPPLAQMFPVVTGKFWRYQGGLTTPTCDEQVVWTVFTDAVAITKSQLEDLRSLDDKGYGTERYRPVQSLGNRQLTLYVPGRW